MSDATTAIPPWIHLPLDERHENSLRDASGHRRNANIAGDVQLATDPVFGQCVELRGGSVILPPLNATDFADGITLLLWVQHRADSKEGNVVKFGPWGRALYSQHGKLHVYSKSISAPVGEWVFVALVIALAPDHLAIRLDGDEDATKEDRMHPLSSLFGEASPADRGAGGVSETHTLILGNGSLVTRDSANHDLPIAEGEKGFRGRLAQLRIYPRALLTDEIAVIRKADLIVDDAVWRGPAVSMLLENDDGLPELYIDGHVGGQAMNLHIGCNTQARLHIEAVAATASEQHWHFRINFRPGALSKLEAARVASPGWTLSVAATPEADTLYLLSTQARTLPLDISVVGLHAASEHGTRTTRAKFYYQNLSGDANGARAGYCSQQLALIHHGGQRTIPLHVGISGSNRIRLGGKADLRILLTNILPTIDAEGRSNELVFGADSHILLSFDDQDGTDWALADVATIKKEVSVAYSATGGVRRMGALEGTGDSTRSKWRLNLRDIALRPLERIDIKLSNVPAKGQEGHSNVYIDLVNIPGYWDARIACAIEKVTPSSVWLPLKLNAPYWKSGPETAPEYYKDECGVVHLRGRCWLLSQEMKGVVDVRWRQFMESIERTDFRAPLPPHPSGHPLDWWLDEPIPDPFMLADDCAPEKAMLAKGLAEYRQLFGPGTRVFHDIAPIAPIVGVLVIRGNRCSIPLWSGIVSDKKMTWRAFLSESKSRRDWSGLWPKDFAGPVDWYVEICLDGFSYVTEVL